MRRKIVVCLTTDKQSYQLEQAKAARAAAVGMAEFELLFSEGNPNLQKQHLFRCCDAPPSERPFAIVVEPMTADGSEEIGRRAAGAGVGWILLHSPPYIEYLSQQFPDLPIASISADNKQIGSLQAQQVRRLLPAGGRMVYIEGPGGNAATIDRRQGMMAGIEGSGIQVVKTIAADWSVPRAEQAVAFWLRLPRASRPDLMAAQNDSMAVGALQALKTLRPDWAGIPLIGVDGLPQEGVRLVREGVLAATIVMPSTAGVGVQLAIRALNGERISSIVVPVQSFPPVERLRQHRGASGLTPP